MEHLLIQEQMFHFHNILKDLTLQRRPNALVWSKGYRVNGYQMGATYSSFGLTKVMYAIPISAKTNSLQKKPKVIVGSDNTSEMYCI